MLIVRMTILLAIFMSSIACGAPHNGSGSDDRIQVAKKLAPSLVRVNFRLRYDQGEPPSGGDWMQFYADYGQSFATSLDHLIVEERPAQQAGFIIGSDAVITRDPQLHPRFVETITVEVDGVEINASIDGVCSEQNAIMLRLDRPVDVARVLTFDGDADGSLIAANYIQNGVHWEVAVSGVPNVVRVRADGTARRAAPVDSLILDAQTRPVGMSFTGTLMMDQSWMGSPLEWDSFDEGAYQSLLKRFGPVIDRTAVRVALSFRSPNKDAASRDTYSFFADEDAEETERNVLGLMIDPTHALVLTKLTPDVTARLERIRVFADSDAVPATFQATLKNYGAFLVELTEPLSGGAMMSAGPVSEYEDDMLVSAKLMISGENRIVHIGHSRISGFEPGWHNHAYPMVDAGEYREFLFDTNGELVAFPVTDRKKAAVEEEWGGNWPIMTATTYIVDALADLETHGDPNNIPLSEEEENRIAWIGLETQPMSQELARASEIVAETRDGQIGVVVAFVYPESPAEKAGLQLGDVLLRVHVPDQPKPIELEADGMSGDFFGYGGAFPWDQLDELPEEYFDQIPPPWPSVNNEMNQKLTSVGFGAAYELEFVRGTELKRVAMRVEQSPAHYTSARKFESESLGLSVRNLTYEVRRYFRRPVGEPGIIITTLEPGSRASIAGLRPFEIITHVNDNPVASIEAFEEIIEGEADLRLSVRRMTRGRVVRLQEEVSSDDE